MGSVALRRFARDCLPPVVLRQWRRWRHWRWFRGDYATWADAQRAAGTYAAEVIFERVLAAGLAVRDGRAAFERDGITFPEPECDVPLVAALSHVALGRGGRLTVLDFGGSLGSTWFQLRPFWPAGIPTSWQVVEQAHLVAAGRQHLATDLLGFHESLPAARAFAEPDVVLASCVLQYLEDPHRWLDELQSVGAPFLVLNNLMLHDAPDRLRVQHTPPEIYPASYPVWMLERSKLLRHFAGRYRVVFEFRSSAVWDVDGSPLAGTGFLLARETEAAR